MQCILFRHGIAVDRNDPDCPPDDARPLTPKGVKRTRAAARGLASLGLAPRAILSSQLLRARQTAELAAEAMGLRPRSVKVTQSLTPDALPDELLEELVAMRKTSVLCVGHAPNLDLVLAEALGLRERPPVRLKKAGAACLELDPGNGSRLVWVMEPGALRRLAS